MRLLNAPVALPIREASQIGEARRIARTVAAHMGFDETTSERAVLIVSEAATNLVRHTPGGELLLRPLVGAGSCGLEILALDQGPGMTSVAECMKDGFSTTGTSGNGLGAISRLATNFDIHSLPGKGTALLARVWPVSAPQPPGALGTAHDGAIVADAGTAGSSARPSMVPPFPTALQFGAVCLPHPGETVSGDAWSAMAVAGRVVVLVADGLGHGPAATEAARAAVNILETHARRSPKEILEAAHGALRSTRGAAAAVAAVDLRQRSIRFAGIGNIAGAVVAAGASHSMVSHNGTVGHEIRKIQEFDYPWPKGALLILHSDGLATRWRLDGYSDLSSRDPSLIAGVLYRDFTRGRDDVTVVVARDATR